MCGLRISLCLFLLRHRERGSKRKTMSKLSTCKNNDDVHQGRGGHGKCDCLVTPSMQVYDKRQLGTRSLLDRGSKDGGQNGIMMAKKREEGVVRREVGCCRLGHTVSAMNAYPQVLLARKRGGGQGII